MANVMELDLSGTTDLLMRTAKAWHEKDKSSPDKTTGIAHYHGQYFHFDEFNESKGLYWNGRPRCSEPR